MKFPVILLCACAMAFAQRGTTVDAHNCYPYNGRWADRIERALSAGTPIAIEQDLLWDGTRSLVSHGKPVDGTEPSMRDYFFERIRPIMEKALHDGRKQDWPLITLNLDFKSDEAEHHAAVWKLLGEYEPWLTTAVRSKDPEEVTPLHWGPLLVLTGEQDSQERDFHDIVPVGGSLRAFGAVHALVHAGNYRRWSNNPWEVAEPGGQLKAGEWTDADQARLQALVDRAHSLGLWIRFYTLNGHPASDERTNGWEHGYNFGSRARVEARWRAAILAHVDYIATDQYEELAKFKAR